jgi:hypothetical protein
MTKRTEPTVERAVMDMWMLADLLQEEIAKEADGPRPEILVACLIEQLKALHYRLDPSGGRR